MAPGVVPSFAFAAAADDLPGVHPSRAPVQQRDDDQKEEHARDCDADDDPRRHRLRGLFHGHFCGLVGLGWWWWW